MIFLSQNIMSFFMLNSPRFLFKYNLQYVQHSEQFYAELQLLGPLIFLFTCSLHADKHLGPDGTRLEQNAQARP